MRPEQGLAAICSSLKKETAVSMINKGSRAHLRYHLVVRVSRECNTLQGGNGPGKQRHVGRH